MLRSGLKILESGHNSRIFGGIVFNFSTNGNRFREVVAIFVKIKNRTTKNWTNWTFQPCVIKNLTEIVEHFIAGTKESAFIRAVTSAGVAHAVTQSCSAGNLTDCSCDMGRQVSLIQSSKKKKGKKVPTIIMKL